LAAAESAEISDEDLRDLILTGLSDLPRSGAPPTFSAEQIVQIVAVACEDPVQSERPISHWTPSELADEAVKRQIVESISPASVGRFLNQADLKPHQVEHWLNAPERDSEEFHEQVKTICELYAQAPQLHAQGVHVISTDEKTGIQALERAAPTKPMLPGVAGAAGQVERQEYEYIRHGTQCLIANHEVATGKQIAPSIGATRTEPDFVAHIAQTVQTAPDDEWVFVVDQLNTHQSESLVCWVANKLQHTGDLGRKGESGILKSMSTRAEFLSRPEHRIRFVYTPKHCSWLNQVEMWFSILVRRLLKRASFTSTEELRQRILDFIEYFNRTLAKPFKWTYRGRPLTV
jgi:transposase